VNVPREWQQKDGNGKTKGPHNRSPSSFTAVGGACQMASQPIGYVILDFGFKAGPHFEPWKLLE